MIEKLSKLWLTPVECWRYSYVRMGFALITIINTLGLWKYRILIFSSEGINDPTVVAITKTLPSYSVFEFFHWGVAVTILFVLSLVVHVALLVGCYPKLAIILSFVWHASLVSTGEIVASGWDHILTNFAFLLMISPSGGMQIFRSENEENLVPQYGLILMRIQVLVIYWQTVFQRFDDEFWLNGEFMYYFFQSFFSRFGGAWALDYLGPLKILSWSALIIELLIPVLLFFKRTYRFGFILGIIFHLGIVLMAKHLEMFSCVILMTYLCFLRTNPLVTYVRLRSSTPAAS